MTTARLKHQPTGPGPTTMTAEEWSAEGARRFGADQMKWRFKCPSCEHIACAEDWKAVGAPEGSVAYSCVGRWMPKTTATIFQKGKGPCNYAGGGLFPLNPITVIDKDGDEHHIFEFAPAEASEAS